MTKKTNPTTKKTPKPRKRRTTNKHYVNNKDLFENLCPYLERVRAAKLEQPGVKKEDLVLPQVPEYIADCIFKICDNMSRKPNFFGYTYREDMVLDGVENCLRYIANFNPEKSTNPFSYFSQIAHFAFIRRIKSEHKETYVKCKAMELAVLDYDKIGDLNPHDTSGFAAHSGMAYDNIYDFIDEYESKMKAKKKDKPEPKKKKLEEFMDDDTKKDSDE